MFDDLVDQSRRKLTAHSNRGTIVTTISRHSKDSSTGRSSIKHIDSSRWSQHQNHLDNRTSILLKLRQIKLQKITDENYKILKRINQQKSQYTHKEALKSTLGNKQNSELGPIAQWMGPTCFMVGDRGIMSQNGVLGSKQNTIRWQEDKPKQIRQKRLSQNRQNMFEVSSWKNSRERQLPSIYMLF